MKTTTNQGVSVPTGDVDHLVTRDLGILRPPAGWSLHNWLKYRRRDLPKLAATRFVGMLPGIVTVEARLSAFVYRRPENIRFERWQRLQRLLDSNIDVRELQRFFGGSVLDYGTLSTRVVTDAGVGFIVDAFQNLVELENMKFHGYGTGTTAEAAGQTALVTELTTEYASDNNRPTGTTTEGATANIYRTVATLTPDTGGTIPVTEHGIFSQAANSGGVLLDRSVFAAVNVVAAADSLQTTYDLTFTSGS